MGNVEELVFKGTFSIKIIMNYKSPSLKQQMHRLFSALCCWLQYSWCNITTWEKAVSSAAWPQTLCNINQALAGSHHTAGLSSWCRDRCNGRKCQPAPGSRQWSYNQSHPLTAIIAKVSSMFVLDKPPLEKTVKFHSLFLFPVNFGSSLFVYFATTNASPVQPFCYR